MLENYKGKPHSLTTNKNKLPINEINFENYEEFNEIYKYCLDHFKQVKPTPSLGVPCNHKYKFNSRFIVSKGNQRYEIVISSHEGDYRFLLKNKKSKENTLRGTSAVRQIYKKANEMGIDLTPYSCTPQEGIEIKKEIVKPHIEILEPSLRFKFITNVYHLDLKSSFASRIVEKYPELFELYNFMYQQRKFKNEYYKHVLTNSIGCFQSRYCPDYEVNRKQRPYQFAKLALAANNGTREKIEMYIERLRSKGFIPILTNTDGIWYKSPTGLPYHDEDEGVNLTQWENDHYKTVFLFTSEGSYQYYENNKVYTVLRGLCNLDTVQPDRSKWEFGDILGIKEVCTYTFEEGKGVIKLWQD